MTAVPEDATSVKCGCLPALVPVLLAGRRSAVCFLESSGLDAWLIIGQNTHFCSEALSQLTIERFRDISKPCNSSILYISLIYFLQRA